MPAFSAAHGLDAGPTQRPRLAGAISGVLATVPAIAPLYAFGSLRVEAQILGLPEVMIFVAGWAVMSMAGAGYGSLFGRGANDRHVGWLLGMSFGFALWAAGAAMVLPLASDGKAAAGEAAIGLFLSLVLWGAALGIIHPLIHRPLHESLSTGAGRTEVGPSAAAFGRGAGRPRDIKPRSDEPPSPR